MPPAAGGALTGELQVNSYTTNDQEGAAVALIGGGFVVAWDSEGQDGSNPGAFAQRFAVPFLLDIDGNGSTDALTDGVLLLRYSFGLRGALLIAGAFDDVGCTRCDAASIEAYLAAHTG